jgi:hypothetical protein
MNGYPNMKKKLVEINDTSSRSRGGNKTSVKPKETDGTAQELPEWAKDMPEYITIKEWDLD